MWITYNVIMADLEAGLMEWTKKGLISAYSEGSIEEDNIYSQNFVKQLCRKLYSFITLSP